MESELFTNLIQVLGWIKWIFLNGFSHNNFVIWINNINITHSDVKRTF